MAKKKRTKALNFFFRMGGSLFLAGAMGAVVLLPAAARSQSSSPDQKIELSTKNLSPEMRELLLKLRKKNQFGKYWKKPKPLVYFISSFKEDVRERTARPGSSDYLYNNGVDFLNSGETHKAIEEFSKVISKSPTYGCAYYNRGLALAMEGKYGPALADFNKYVELDSRDAEAYYHRGLINIKQGRYAPALADLNKSLELNPQDAQAYYLRGFVYYKQGQGDRARSDYQKALGLNREWVKQAAVGKKSELDNYPLILEGKTPKPAGVASRQAEAAHKKQGLTLARKEQYDKSLKEFNQALKLDPKDPETYNNRGSIYTLKGNYEAALADFTQALALNPKYAKAYYNRALAYYYQGKYDQAIQDLTKAIKLKPKDVAAYNNRGLAYMQKGDYERALDDFNMAVILNPKLSDAYFNKAAACEKTGRADEARRAYAAFIKYAPPGAKARIELARGKLR